MDRWVVKLGGSLQNSSSLTAWLDRLLAHGRGRVVIVPGGGEFADAVRQSQLRWRFDDAVAHKMALLAMEQYAHLLSGLAPGLQPVSDLESIKTCLAGGNVALWLPCKMVLDAATLPATWQLTSDSLAAWLAMQLQYNSLLLVKSVALPAHFPAYEQLVASGLIDPILPTFLRQSSIQLSWMESGQSAMLADVLSGKRASAVTA